MAAPKIKTRFRFSRNGESFNARWEAYQKAAAQPGPRPTTLQITAPWIQPDIQKPIAKATPAPAPRVRRFRPVRVLAALFLGLMVAAAGALALPFIDRGQLEEALERTATVAEDEWETFEEEFVAWVDAQEAELESIEPVAPAEIKPQKSMRQFRDKLRGATLLPRNTSLLDRKFGRDQDRDEHCETDRHRGGRR